jgi:hypothetical protein
MTDQTNSLVPSLLDPEAQGGSTAEGGISFQTGVVLTYLPHWLAQEGFTMFLREGLGDTEVRFFVPGQGFRKEFLEVKDHLVTPAEFWAEFARFRQVAAAGGEFVWFTLATAGLSDSLHPLINGLRRIRDPRDFYEGDFAIRQQSYQDYVVRVVRLGHSVEDAEFLYRKVLIRADLSLHRDYSQALFKQALRDELPECADLPDRVLAAVYSDIAAYVESRRNQPILRSELEARIQSQIPSQWQIPLRPIRLFTGNGQSAASQDDGAVRFEWSAFFNSDYPPPAVWNTQLLADLRATRDWILAHRINRRLRVSGDRRLSANLAIGWAFSAVAGFTIEMVYRDGATWATDAHPRLDTPAYPLTASNLATGYRSSRLVVSIGILRDITPHVEAALPPHGLTGMPVLHFHGATAIESPEQLNLLIRAIKAQISDALAQTAAQQIDLFLLGPAPLALFLGHRLNGLAQVQCYNWAPSGRYVPTCLLDV